MEGPPPVFDEDRHSDLLIPRDPPTRDRPGIGFALVRIFQMVVIAALAIEPFTWLMAVFAAAAILTVVVDVARHLSTQKLERVTDQGRWQLLRKMTDFSRDDLAADARQLSFDEAVHFYAGADAVVAHFRAHAEIISAQTTRDLRRYF